MEERQRREHSFTAGISTLLASQALSWAMASTQMTRALWEMPV